MKTPRSARQLALGLHPDAKLTWKVKPDTYKQRAKTLYSVHWGGKPADDSCRQVQGYDRTDTWERAYKQMLADLWQEALEL